jgi:hypothetical protein
LCDKGFNGRAFAAAQAARGTAVLIPPAKDQRARMPALLLKVIAQWRNRIEASFGEITEQMGLTRHGAHTFWGLLALEECGRSAYSHQGPCGSVPGDAYRRCDGDAARQRFVFSRNVQWHSPQRRIGARGLRRRLVVV